MPPLKPAIEKALDALIKNDDRPLNWFVALIAKKHQVNSFQCRTAKDAEKAAQLIKERRALEGLPTERATRKQLLHGTGRKKEFGPLVDIELS